MLFNMYTMLVLNVTVVDFTRTVLLHYLKMITTSIQ